MTVEKAPRQCSIVPGEKSEEKGVGDEAGEVRGAIQLTVSMCVLRVYSILLILPLTHLNYFGKF